MSDKPLNTDADNEISEIVSQYDTLEKKFGKRGRDWDAKLQILTKPDENGRIYDIHFVNKSDGTREIVKFDITRSFGKFRNLDSSNETIIKRFLRKVFSIMKKIRRNNFVAKWCRYCNRDDL